MSESNEITMGILSKINLFRPVRILKDLEDIELAYVEKRSVIRHFKKFDLIYRPGDRSEQIYFVLNGRVKIGTHSEDGKELIKAILDKGAHFGELTITGEAIRGDFAQAMDDEVELAMIKKNDFEELMSRFPNLALTITNMMGSRLKRAERRLESLIFKDARSRIVDFLLDLAEEHGQPVGLETLILNRLTHQEIANLTATSRQTVTTVMNDLRDKNLIYFDRKRILIRDVKTLA